MKTCLPARTAAKQLDGSCAGGALGENGCEECWNKKKKEKKKTSNNLYYNLLLIISICRRREVKKKIKKSDQCFFKLKRHRKYARFVLRSGIM